MRLPVLNIMQNDSLRRQLLRDYNYDSGLVEEEILQMEYPTESKGDSFGEAIGRMFDGIVSFIHDVPSVVWVIMGIFLFSMVVYVLYRNGVFSFYRRYADEPLAAEDDIYEIDYDAEMSAAVDHQDYPGIVRLVYLSTLRRLDEQGRIAWRIYKTPSQFASEVGDSRFTRMTRCFLRVRYGRYPASAQLCDEMRHLSRELLEGGAA